MNLWDYDRDEDKPSIEPGDVLILKDPYNGETKRVLVGNINRSGGTCSCCDTYNTWEVIEHIKEEK